MRRISILLHESEIAAWEAKAEELGVTLPEWMRIACNDFGLECQSGLNYAQDERVSLPATTTTQTVTNNSKSRVRCGTCLRKGIVSEIGCRVCLELNNGN